MSKYKKWFKGLRDPNDKKLVNHALKRGTGAKYVFKWSRRKLREGDTKTAKRLYRIGKAKVRYAKRLGAITSFFEKNF